jgi:hypothetical protein
VFATRRDKDQSPFLPHVGGHLTFPYFAVIGDAGLYDGLKFFDLEEFSL